MEFLGWVIVIALLYWAAGSTLFLVIDAVQRRKWLHIPLVVLAYGMARYWSLSGTDYELSRQIRFDTHMQAGIYAATLCVWLLVPRKAAAEKLTWQDKKRRKELSRQIKLHLALVTGAIVFSVPFYWLVTTSLKPDVRTNQFPPDLIPMKQSSVKIDGQDRDVYLMGKVKVVKMGELEGDKWQVAQVGQAAPSS